VRPRRAASTTPRDGHLRWTGRTHRLLAASQQRVQKPAAAVVVVVVVAVFGGLLSFLRRFLFCVAFFFVSFSVWADTLALAIC